MANIYVFLLLFTFYMYGTLTHTLKTSFQCNGTDFQYKYREIFSLSLTMNNDSVAYMNNGGAAESVPNREANVSNLTGVWTEDDISLQGLVDIECRTAGLLVCELYGYVSEVGSYKSFTFAPNIEFYAGIGNSSLNQQSPEATPEDVLLTCSAIVGSNRTKVSWESRAPGEQYSNVNERFYTVERTVLPHCRFMFTSRLSYIHQGHGFTYFRCMYGKTEVGSITVGYETEGDSGDLPCHLFLSSIVLVYAHFVILPLFCTFLQRMKLIGNLRNPGNEQMRKLRGGISFCVALAFSIWWVITIILKIYSHGEYASYLSFFLIEAFFLFVYAVIRLLSNRLEKRGDRHLYNGRVALSCGAVITPSVCWIMIKSQQIVPFSGLECFWWIMTVFSLLAFVFVSHARELKAWEKDQ